MISDLVRILLAANTPHDVIVEAIRAVESNAIDIQAEKRRTADRERKRCLRNSAESAEIVELPSNGFPHPSLTPNSLPKEKPPKGGKKKNPLPSRLKADWELPQEWGDWAETEGLTGEEILREAEKFRDYWLGNGKTKVDWEATWRNWIRRNLESKNNAVQSKITNKRY